MKQKDRIQTTDEDFKEFITHCERYAQWLGLGEWKLYYEHGGTEGAQDGNMQRALTQRKATVRLAKKLHSLETVVYVARHEICEVILCAMDWAAGMGIARDVVEEYRHEAINHIVKLLEMLDKQHEKEKEEQNAELL